MFRSHVLAAASGAALAYFLPAIYRRLRPQSAASTHAVRGGASHVNVPRGELSRLVAACLEKAGATAQHAELVASVLVYADSRGIPSHGVNRADFYCTELERGLVDGQAEPVVEKDEGCCALVDGQNGLGAVCSERAIRIAIDKARKLGVGWVVCRRSNHFGAAGFWAQQALQEGLLAFSFTNTAPFMVPSGGSTRAVGTNPICCMAPAANDSFQLDMATTTVPIGKVEVMDRLGKALPLGWGVDSDGKPCTDAAEVATTGGLTPLGGYAETAGYKGYGLGMLVEVLSAVLSGAAVGPDVPGWNAHRGRPMDFGHCFIVLDPTRFADGFDERLGRYLAQMRNLPGNVLVPGDPEKQYERDAAAKGVQLHTNVAKSLRALADKLGIDGKLVPAPLAQLDATAVRGSLMERKG